MISSKPPTPRDGKKQVPHWSYESVPCGTHQNGFIAGGVFGAWNHFENRKSYVCRKEMSDSVLVCERCQAGFVPEWRGYVPWYDREYTRRFSLITYEYLESVKEIELHAQIELSRGKPKTSPCVIRSRAWRTTPLPPNESRRESVNLHDFLVYVLWGDEALMRFARGVVSAPSIPGTVEPGKFKLDTEALASAFTAQAEKSEGVAERSRRNALFVRDVQEKHTKTNGHPKGSPGG